MLLLIVVADASEEALEGDAQVSETSEATSASEETSEGSYVAKASIASKEGATHAAPINEQTTEALAADRR